MAKNLVIVESPAKAKTIEGFLGNEFEVKSSFGHVRDLALKGLAVDTENHYKPNYEISEDKIKIINELKKLSKQAETTWLATDEDREGEAISWHLFDTLGLDEKKTKRIVFHEITKSAIQKAIANPRGINYQLVEAQQARRILDRLVGFELSPVLWKKIKPSLSAGRVQSVAVRLLVEREREVTGFKTISSYKIVALFPIEKGGVSAILKAEHPNRFKTKQDAEKFLVSCVGKEFSIKDLETKPGKKSPSPPFTTSTLQQEASRKLGFSVLQTMTVAQHLYEAGKITYMRTDSVNLSETAIDAAKDEIIKSFGDEYVKTRRYETKTKGAQEAHEAIRPTYMSKQKISGDKNEVRLYDLIWKRTIASQMSDAIIERTIATIAISGIQDTLIAAGEVIKFDGFLKVYMEGSDEEDEEQKGMLPPLTIGEKLLLKEMTATERFTQHPPRYTEASLVKKLEELGIGRPSTYAPTISTIQKRGYVVKEDRPGAPRNYNVLTLSNNKIKDDVKTEQVGVEKAKLFPTDIGMVVNDFLITNFHSIMDYNFTADVEKEFDEIAHGQMNWEKMIDGFYKPFHKTVEKASESAERPSGERVLGVDPVSGKKVHVRIGRFGPMVQVGDSEGEEKPKYSSLKKEQRIDTITLEQALDLFKLPRTVGEYEGKELVIGVGRFGPFVKHNEAYYSLKKEDDPLTIDAERAIQLIEEKRTGQDGQGRVVGQYEGKDMTLGKGRFGPYIKHDGAYYSLKKDDNPSTLSEERAIQLIEEKKLADKEKVIKEFPKDKNVKILNGRYGPYIAIGKANHKIPKGADPAGLTLEDCLKIAAESPAPAKKKFVKKGK